MFFGGGVGGGGGSGVGSFLLEFYFIFQLTAYIYCIVSPHNYLEFILYISIYFCVLTFTRTQQTLYFAKHNILDKINDQHIYSKERKFFVSNERFWDHLAECLEHLFQLYWCWCKQSYIYEHTMQAAAPKQLGNHV